MKQIRQRLTYANVMSSIAVFFILGGATAFAATKIGANEIKANSIKTGKIVKEAVTAGKIKNGAITTNKIANLAVTEAKIADKAVTGAKINVTTLGTVPNATNATNAVNATNAANANTVNHQSVASFFKEIPTSGAASTALDFGGVKITASCPANVPTLSAAKNSTETAAARFSNVEETAEARGNGQSTFSTLALTAKQLGGGTLEVVFANGSVTTVTYAWRDDAFNGTGCRFFGHAVTG